MAFDRDQFRDFISRTLDRLGSGGPAAVQLLCATAAVESGFGTYLRQKNGGPALGVYQMELATESDIWGSYLHFRPALAERVWTLTWVDGPRPTALEGNLIYQTVMARIHYLRVRAMLPDAEDIEGMARYWKRYWNTGRGSGSLTGFLTAWDRYMGE